MADFPRVGETPGASDEDASIPQADTPAGRRAAQQDRRRAEREALREARRAEREAGRAARKAARSGGEPVPAAAETSELPALPDGPRGAAQPTGEPGRTGASAGSDVAAVAGLRAENAHRAAAPVAGTVLPPGYPFSPPPPEFVQPGRKSAGRPATARRTGNDPAAAGAGPEPIAAGAVLFDILLVAQGGGLDRQAAILAASLRRNARGFAGRLVVAEPLPQDAWQGVETRIGAAARAALESLGAEIRPFAAHHFGRSYPYGNKIEALGVLEPGRPFLFLDSDTLITGDIGAVPFDFARPSASMRREGTWPDPPLYGPGHDEIWRSLYERFGLDMDGSLDLTQPAEHWERFLYFNAGWFFGDDPAEFGRRFLDWACVVRDDPGEALACQSLDPWLDQVVLPLVIHSLGGGRPGPELSGLDGEVTTHWRNLPLLYARGPERAIAEMEAVADLPQIAPLMQGWEPAERLIRGGEGRGRIAPMFADAGVLPEKTVRQRLRAAGLWLV